MLKLTDSFCRYLRYTYKKVERTSVRENSLSYSKRKTCVGVCPDLKAQFHTSLPQGYSKKRPKIRIPSLNSNVTKKHKQMSDPLQPTVNHVCCGGKFYVSPDYGNDPCEEFKRQTSETASDYSDKAGNETHRQGAPIPFDFRVWESVGKNRDSRDACSVKFKVLSYNVLAQYLLECHPYLYTECCPRNLKWKVRAPRLYDEIINIAPDILCLQEVQASHLNSFYSKFEEIGYFGIFKQKTGHRQDGCAIYFKQSLFEMEDHVSVEYYQPDLPILNRDNIGIMVKLRPRGLPDCPVVVATTHLLYNPRRTDVRLAQMQLLLAELDRFAYYNDGQESGHLPIILTGDFNSTPQSAVVNLLDRGHVSAGPFRDSSDWKRIGVTDNCQHLSVYLNRQAGRTTNYDKLKIYNSDYCARSPEACGTEHSPTSEQFSEMFNSGVLGHSLLLTSVYNHEQECDRATSFADYWVTVDYIYFSCCTSLRLLERLRLPTVAECDVLGRLPNDVYGSDHLALAAVFELKPSKSAL